MRLLAIDPGNEESALLIYDEETKLPIWHAKLPNNEALRVIANPGIPGVREMHVEMIASYGMAVGKSVFETCVWIGRFVQQWKLRTGSVPGLVYRLEVKQAICRSPKANDSNIRQALIDRYGGKEKAIGRKATPGPLYGIGKDVWSALAVAITVAERG